MIVVALSSKLLPEVLLIAESITAGDGSRPSAMTFTGWPPE